MKEGIDPYFKERLERSKEHRVLTSIDLSEFQKREAESNKELPSPFLEGTIDEFGWSQKAVDNIIDALDNGHIRINRLDGERIRIEFAPLAHFPEQLGQVSELEAVKKNLVGESGVYGSQKEGELTYLQTTDFAVEGYMDDEQEGKRYGRVYVDAAVLSEDRAIYLDLESIHITDYEYGYSFCVYGGIPFRAIQKIDVIQARKLEKRAETEIDTSDWSDNPNEEAERQAQRLRTHLTSIGI